MRSDGPVRWTRLWPARSAVPRRPSGAYQYSVPEIQAVRTASPLALAEEPSAEGSSPSGGCWPSGPRLSVSRAPVLSIENYATQREAGGLMMVHLIVALALVAAPSSCGDAKESAGNREVEVKADQVVLELSSPAFVGDSLIPKEYTCDSTDVSPAIFWSGVPEGTKSLALICDDPDAPGRTWVHWVLYGIPPDADSLPKAVPGEEEVLGGVRQGLTDFNRVGYGGPCPPKGSPHRYFFKLYAIDVELELEPGKTKEELLKAMEGHIIGQGQLVGRYGR